MFHIAKVVKLYSKHEKELGVQATLEMWDENVITVEVLSKVSKEIKQGSFVLVDYRPTQGLQIFQPRQTVCRVLEAKEGAEAWAAYKNEFERLKRMNRPAHQAQGPQYM